MFLEINFPKENHVQDISVGAKKQKYGSKPRITFTVNSLVEAWYASKTGKACKQYLCYI